MALASRSVLLLAATAALSTTSAIALHLGAGTGSDASAGLSSSSQFVPKVDVQKMLMPRNIPLKRTVITPRAGDLPVVPALKATSSMRLYCGIKGKDTTPWPGSAECSGAPVARSVEGVEATPHEYPWQLAFLQQRGPHLFFICEATLITPKMAITAAHCTDSLYKQEPETLRVLVGAHNLADSKDGVLVGVKRVIQHPDWDSMSFNHDFSLLHLEDFDMPVGSGFACLPPDVPWSQNVSFDAAATGWSSLSSGGSESARLREVQVDLLPTTTTCKETYGEDLTTGDIFCGQSTCASQSSVEVEMKPSMCQSDLEADSGGGLMCKSLSNTSSYYIEGVISWGFGCGTAPAVYASIRPDLEWIKENLVGENQAPLPLGQLLDSE